MRMAHNPRMKILLFLGGLRPPKSSRWGGLAAPTAGGWGNPVSPYFHLRRHSRGAQRRDEHGVSLGGPPPPWPSPAGGGNRAPPRREGIGETWFPRMFTSESATPLAFVYSFPIRWPISPLRPRKPFPEQVKPVEGLRPPKPSRGRALFTLDSHAAAPHNAGMKIIMFGRA